MTRYDAVVVGAGSAGAVVASRLSEGAHRVLLLEAGPGDDAPELRGRSFGAAMALPDRVWSEPAYVRGRGLGGSSAINGMVAERGAPADYDGWGVGGWSWRDVEPWFARIRVPLRHAEASGPLGTALLAADPAARLAMLTCTRDGRRASTADVYLPRDGLEVRAGVEVVGVLLDGRRAVGVRLAGGGEVEAGTVIVSAGAINTPLLLLASGVEVEGIGDNLQDHVGSALPVMLHVPVPAAAPDISVIAGTGDLQLMAMDRVHREPGLGLLIAGVLRTHSRGRVGPEGITFDLDERDRGALAAARQMAVTTLGHPAMRAACTRLEAEADWAERAVYHHAAGTCAMGAVVDDAGAVRGYSNLYVCDASVIPVLPRAGTHLPTVMLAERLASVLRERLSAAS